MGFLDKIRPQRSPAGDPEWFVLCSSTSHGSVVGEASYQPCLQKTVRGASAMPPFGITEWPFQDDTEPRPWFPAYLRREPDNRYDANAVVVESQHGVIGYLSREDAEAYQPVLQLLESHGHRGGVCAAYAREADNGMWGVVLALSGPGTCLDFVRAEKSFRVT